MRHQLLKVRRIDGQTFYASPDRRHVDMVADGDNDSHAYWQDKNYDRIEQAEYWLIKLRQAREERDQKAIEEILNTDDMVGTPEGWVPL